MFAQKQGVQGVCLANSHLLSTKMLIWIEDRERDILILVHFGVSQLLSDLFCEMLIHLNAGQQPCMHQMIVNFIQYFWGYNLALLILSIYEKLVTWDFSISKGVQCTKAALGLHLVAVFTILVFSF